MDSFDALARTVEQALRDRRIGTPSSVRLVVFTAADHGLVAGTLSRAADAVCRWLDAKPVRVSALGGLKEGRITAIVLFDGGQSAAISVGVPGVSGPMLEACIVGSHGVLGWEPAGAEAAAPSAPATPKSVESPAAALLVKGIHAALDQGRMVAINAQGPAPSPPSDATANAAPAPTQARPPAQPRAHAPRTPPFGVLLISGSGTHQEDYARALAADPRCRLIGLTDSAAITPRRRELNERLAGELKMPILPDLDAALARDDVHIVCVCAEPERRAPIIVKCAAAGKALYLDKPLTANLAEARDVVAAVRRAGVLSHMFSLAHAPVSWRVRRAVEAGTIGEIRGVHCDQYFAKGHVGTAAPGAIGAKDPHPTQFEAIDSKRELYNVGVYPLVFFRWLLGKDVRRVSAFTGNYFFKEHQQNGMEDFATALFELDGGTTASFTVGRTGWRSHPLGGVNKTYLIGSQGVMCIDAFRPRLEVWSDETPWDARPAIAEDPMAFWKSTPARMGLAPKRSWVLPDEDPHFDVRYFLDCVEQGRESDVSAEVGAAAVAALVAAFESAATARSVAVQSVTGS